MNQSVVCGIKELLFATKLPPCKGHHIKIYTAHMDSSKNHYLNLPLHPEISDFVQL